MVANIKPKIQVPKTAETPPSRRMPNKNVLPFFQKLAAAIEKPETELEYQTNFELLIAVILSAQATDVSVNLATRKLYAVANTPQAILDLGEAGLKSYIKTIGLYNSKAKNVMKCCQDLVDKFASEVPQTRHELESLAGVGRKTANVVLNTAFGQPPWQWIPIFFVLVIAQAWQRVKMCEKWKINSSREYHRTIY